MQQGDLCIRPFDAEDQHTARRLILDGLGEHFGFIDESYNPDINDILATYITAGETFVVAEIDGTIVGTGALITERAGVGRLVRMSVAREQRRQGIGRALVAHLVEQARARGFAQLVLETNQGWHDAIGLYRACGFSEAARTDGLVHMVMDLRSAGG
jgi:GNAT superfamily N-acetyltransferase